MMWQHHHGLLHTQTMLIMITSVSVRDVCMMSKCATIETVNFDAKNASDMAAIAQRKLIIEGVFVESFHLTDELVGVNH
jgi:hypothetical protein